MSLFSKRAQTRSISSLPWDQGGPKVQSDSMAHQLGLIPVFAAVRLISDSISTLPLQQFRKTADSRQPMPLAKVLDAPSAYGTRIEWVQRGLVSALLAGNAYGLKTGYDPATAGYASIEWLDPSKVRDEPGDPDWFYEGRRVPSSQILHIPALVVPGRRRGISPMTATRTSIEAGLEAQQFTRDWFRNRAVPGLIFKNVDRTIAPDVAAATKERLTSTLRAGEPFVSGNDWTLDVIKMPADDAGFVSAAKLTATQIASIYGVPPEMIGGETGNSLTYSTVELNQIAFLTNTLRPWITRFEAALSGLLPRPQFVKFNVDALLRVDAKTRHEIYQIDRNIGLRNVDEERALEDLEPLPDGKGQDYTPLAGKATAPTKETR